MIKIADSQIAIIGLGYVGLPLAVEFGKHYVTLGFDINQVRIAELSDGVDHTLEVSSDELKQATKLRYSCELDDLRQANVYIVTVPTPIDEHRQPDLTPLVKASETLGKVIKAGDVVIYESTVYPGATEEDCIPVIERVSGLRYNVDFFAGYSPERINPGDKEHRVTTIKKVTSGSTAEVAEFVDSLYGSIITAGTYKASSIRVAEAAKVIENTQRDLNIALMNELSRIFDLMGINTYEVLAAAGTKWNFLKFFPGLVGGHCIGVDPYYLTYKANELGYTPEVILAGRKINDDMGAHVARKLVQQLIKLHKQIDSTRVLVMGATFKENVSDIRNSKVVDVIEELKKYSVNTEVSDPYADSEEFHEEYGIHLRSDYGADYDAVILAVNHDQFSNLDDAFFSKILKKDGIVVDVKGELRNKIKSYTYWSL